MFLRRLTLDEIEHGWRALHAEEASHQSAQCSCTNLYSFSCRQLDLLTEQRKIDTDDYQSHTQDPFQYVVFNACQSKDGYCRHNNKRQQYRPKSFPSDIASHSPHDDSRGGNGQKSGSALHKTGSDAQQEYGYNKATHRYSVKKKSISLPLLAAGLE